MIAGIDTAGDRWHAVDDQGVITSCGPLKHTNKAGKEAGYADPDVRRKVMTQEFDGYLELLIAASEGDPGKVMLFVEYPIALRNPKTNIILAMAAAALWDRAMVAGVQWVWVDISVWKRVIVGSGNAGKPEIQAHVLLNWGPEYAMDDNVADARCILEYGEITLRDNRTPALL